MFRFAINLRVMSDYLSQIGYFPYFNLNSLLGLISWLEESDDFGR